MPDDKVVQLDDIRAAAKTVRMQYHEYSIVLKFDKDTKLWTWKITRTHIFTLTGTEKTEKKAMKEAQHAADLVRTPHGAT